MLLASLSSILFSAVARSYRRHISGLPAPGNFLDFNTQALFPKFC